MTVSERCHGTRFLLPDSGHNMTAINAAQNNTLKAVRSNDNTETGDRRLDRTTASLRRKAALGSGGRAKHWNVDVLHEFAVCRSTWGK